MFSIVSSLLMMLSLVLPCVFVFGSVFGFSIFIPSFLAPVRNYWSLVDKCYSGVVFWFGVSIGERFECWGSRWGCVLDLGRAPRLLYYLIYCARERACAVAVAGCSREV